jgi:hypothetical protein
MTEPKKSFVVPKKFWVLAALAVFVGHRLPLDWRSLVPAIPSVVVPAIDVAGLTPPERTLWQTAARLTTEDRATIRDFYSGLARAVAADPVQEPAIPDTPSLRRAHRAGLLFVWSGLAGNQPGKYPGLSDALEGMLTASIGQEEVPLNPAIRQSAVDCFNKVAAICTSAQR